jgi:hypothetical protein
VNGNGIYNYANGKKLEGEFRNGSIYNGKGFLVMANMTFEGEFKDGRYSGYGILTIISGSDKKQFEGIFKDGNPWSGTGFLKFNDFDYYNGSISDGKYNGQGELKIISQNTKILKGFFKDGNLVNGWGHVVINDITIESEISGGKFNGKGTASDSKGNRFSGTFVDGMFSNGTYTGHNGYKYTGGFKDNKPNGQGTIYYKDGYKYIGNVSYGQRWGDGTLYNSSGTKVYEGHWGSDKPTGTYNQSSSYWSNDNSYDDFDEYDEYDY